MLAAGSVPAPAAPVEADLEVSIAGMRNGNGAIMLCLTRRVQQAFLTCDKDPARVTRTVLARDARQIEFRGMVPGDYSLLVVHDENRNGKLDTAFGIPREGFGFSRNPAIRMGPPHYADVHFAVPPGRSSQAIKLKYLL